MGAWPNGKALDYESRDCRFDPCRAHTFLRGPDKSGMLRFVTQKIRALVSNVLGFWVSLFAKPCGFHYEIRQTLGSTSELRSGRDTYPFTLLSGSESQTAPVNLGRPTSTHQRIMRAKTAACSVLPDH
jgi:hypothetical protein